MENKYQEVAEIIFILAFCLSSVFFLSLYGRAHVAKSEVDQFRAIAQPADAYYEWEKFKVHGRILILFARQLNAEESESDVSVTGDNYIYQAAKRNMIRKIYHIIPDGAWSEVERTLSQFPMVAHSKDTFRFDIAGGVPVLIMRIKDVPALKEKVLINIDGGCWSEKELNEISFELQRKDVESDLVTASNILDGNLKGFGVHGQYFR